MSIKDIANSGLKLQETSEILNELEQTRARVSKGLCGSIYKELGFRCVLFIHDMNIKMPGSGGTNGQVQAALAAIGGCACVFEEYAQMAELEEGKQLFGHLSTFAIMQGITQLVEAVEQLSIIVRAARSDLKRRSYWDFRNNHTHVFRDHPNEDGFDIHAMPAGQTQFGMVRYMSYAEGKAGYSVQVFSVERALQVFSVDLQNVFDSCLAAIK